MEDPRSFAIIGMATSLIASGAPQYAHRSVAEVAAELTGVADDIDDLLFGPPGEDDGSDQGGSGTETRH